MYLSPPHTTGIHQALDQIFKSWHDTFNGVVKRWCEENTGVELSKGMFTQIFAEAWTKWTTPDKIVAAFRRVGLSIDGIDLSAVPKEKFTLASTVAKPPPALPPPALPALLPPSQTALPQLAGQAGPSGASPLPVAATPEPATRAIDLSGEYESPSPEAGLFKPDSKEYWQEKARLSSQRARQLFSQAKTMHNTPITLKETHPAWQVKKALPPKEDDGKGKQRVKGEWGDMDSAQMLEKLEAQEKEEEERKEEAAERMRDMETRRAEREAAEKEKKALREARLELEMPVTDLLKRLAFTGEQQDEVSAKELEAFAQANKPALHALGVDLSSYARKNLMPKIATKLAAAPATTNWVQAPPKLLTASTDAELMPPPPPATTTTTDLPLAQPAPTNSAEGTPTKPAPKQSRRLAIDKE
jgi:hypothetical protein